MGSTISSSTVLNNTILNSLNWPITISGGTSSNPIIITFSSDITLQGAEKYFVIGGGYVIIDGINQNDKFSKYKINIQSTTNYPGFVQNGTESIQGFPSVIIKNLIINSDSSTLALGGGWFAQSYFANGAFANNISDCECYADLDNDNCGGIVGSYGGYSQGTLLITNCVHMGNVVGNGSGGIVGYGSSSNYIPIIALPETIIQNSYHIGPISGNNSGGIFGSFCSGFCFNCYSIGNITGTGSGGIAGQAFGTDAVKTNQSNLSVINFNYMIGNISSNSSGTICGSNSSNEVQIYNCYLNGTSVSNSAIGLPGQAIISNFYLTNNWIDLQAKNILQGCPIYNSKTGKLVNPIGLDWIDTSSQNNSIPWILSSYNKSYYLTEASESIFPGETTTIQGVSGPGISYSIVAVGKNNTPYIPEKYPTITINSSNGIILTTQNTRHGNYKIYVKYTNSNNSGYSVSIFELEIKRVGLLNPYSIDRCKCKK